MDSARKNTPVQGSANGEELLEGRRGTTSQ
jgi:hypothetical protein